MLSRVFLLLLTFSVAWSQVGLCPELCSNCNNLDSTCRSCYLDYPYDSYDIVTYSGSCDCPAGYYKNSTTNRCDFCDITC